MTIRILLAEDHLQVRDVIIRKLHQLGYEVTWAADGAELLRRLDADPAYHAVITDNQMPVTTGLQALAKIRENPKFEKLPVIVHTTDLIVPEVEKLGGVYVNKLGKRRLHEVLKEVISSLEP